ncbi:serine/threonine protein kinase [Alsobacter metallidurans]|uniref:non-specific serine/threonine protein kinase n=1 Tax=Alsobacter metallidurans TaxID=340221 RepID=A0A917MHU6_9HYPH|nr:bifunctional serine/threonine-protein kinase/universal stress protein [Alsobacter metallidurans]GGH06653.1 serine/threonine protein kinase [Alsobacter metallidurans]
MGQSRPQPGDVIDGFRLDTLVHRGPMSTLWRVSRPGREGGAPLVMKIPSLAEGEDVSAIVGFELEQMILPRLSGPHVPRFVAAGDFDETPHLVMEWIEGESLQAILAREGKLAPERVAAIGVAAARALQDLHRQHVIHLDLKPANILLRPNGDVTFIDFGLSRHDELPDLLAEESDAPMGTSPYISPEQVLGVRTEPKSDHFALGAVLYELTTGRQPFGDPQRKAGMMRRLWRDPLPPRAIEPSCPPWLQEAILRCLAVEPARLYGSAAQLAFALSNPEQAPLGPNAAKLRQDGFWTVLRRRLRAPKRSDFQSRRVSADLDAAAIVVAAVDLAGGVDELAARVRVQAGRAVEGEPGARLACVTVLKTALLSLEETAGDQGRSAYVQRLVELKDWARELALPADKVSYHVLEAVDPAAALIDYVSKNQVDHLVLGARGSSALRRYLGSVSSEVVAKAPCTVTVVRLRAPDTGG